jgi:hypothetical protein
MIIDTDKLTFSGWVQARSFVEYHDDLLFVVDHDNVVTAVYGQEVCDGDIMYHAIPASAVHQTEADAIRAAIGWCESSPNAILYENKIKKLEKRLAELEKEP